MHWLLDAFLTTVFTLSKFDLDAFTSFSSHVTVTFILSQFTFTFFSSWFSFFSIWCGMRGEVWLHDTLLFNDWSSLENILASVLFWNLFCCLWVDSFLFFLFCICLFELFFSASLTFTNLFTASQPHSRTLVSQPARVCVEYGTLALNSVAMCIPVREIYSVLCAVCCVQCLLCNVRYALCKILWCKRNWTE